MASVTQRDASSGGSPAARRAFHFLAALLAAALLAYACMRAVYVPLSYDEAANHARYVTAEWLAVFDFSVATNHLLNTIATRLVSTVAGDSPFAMRLPNLVAWLAFLAASWAIVARAAHRGVALAGFVLVSANLYLVDYFALSRGYGLSMALFTASLYFLLRCVTNRSDGRGRTRDLTWLLALGVAAVAANFSVLTGVLAVVGVVLADAAVRARAPFAGGDQARLAPRPWHVAAWLLVATAFSGIVVARDAVLSEELFAPVTVRIVGLYEDELDAVRVVRADSRDRLRPLQRSGGGLYRTENIHHAWGLRIEMPPRAERNLTRIDVTMGDRTFSRTRSAEGPWVLRNVGNTARLDATADLALPRSSHQWLARGLNWRGDGPHRHLVAQGAGIAVAALAGLAAAAWMCAWFLTSRGWLDRVTARLVCIALLWTATIVAAPVYLLRRNVQLYYGGDLGLVPDTFGSLLTGSLYGAVYPPWVAGSVAMTTAAALLALPVALLVGRGLRRSPLAASAIATGGVIALVLLQQFAQRELLHTPYLLGRTALWLLPLLVVHAVLVADLLASRSRIANRALTAVLAVAAVATLAHAASRANLTHVMDWPRDAQTTTMLDDVAAAVAAQRPRPPVVRIGVEWIFYPVAKYYAARRSNAVTRYDISVVPTTADHLDYTYTESASPWATGEPLHEYPIAGAVLRRVRPAP